MGGTADLSAICDFISTSVAFSSLNALTLSPALCATILRPLKPSERGALLWFNQVLNKSRDTCFRLWQLLRRKVSVIALLLGLVILGVMGFLKISQTSFIPERRSGRRF